MIFGVDISQHQLSWEELLSRARFAEDAGFESAWVFDHFTPLYGDSRGPCMEANTLLAALSASTSRIRIGSLVTGVTYRHPSVLAAEIVTIDHVSGGRVNFGIGAAWHEDEHRRLGIDFPGAATRARRLEEAIEVCRRLWTEDGSDLEGRYYRLQGGSYHPWPVQQPHPPIWVGAGGRRLTLPIAGRQADVWHCFGSPESLDAKWEVVRRAAEDAGRDPATITRATDLSLSEPWDEVRDTVGELAARGVGRLVVSWPSEGWSRIEDFASDVMPSLG